MPAMSTTEDPAPKGRTKLTAEQKRKGYPENWNELAESLKEKAGFRCERCGHIHDPENGYALTVHHLDMDPSNCELWNLAVLDQRCHLTIQGRVKMDQLFFLDILPVSGWFKPHYEGYLRSLVK